MSSAASPSLTISRIIPRRFAKRCARCAPSIPMRALWAVLEPRSNTLRRKVLENDLVESLRLADRVILAGVYQQQRIPDAERLHPEDVVDALNAAGTPAELHPDATEIVESIAPQLEIRRCGRHPLQWRLRRHL